jgi:sodium transport system permease protein
MSAPDDARSAKPGDQGRPGSRALRGFPRMRRLLLKELRETLRDRRTIVTLVLMPVLVYPLLSLGFQKLMMTSYYGPGAGEVKLLVGLETSPYQTELRDLLKRGDEFLAGLAAIRRSRSKPPNKEEVAEDGALTPESQRYNLRLCEDVAQSVAAHDIDVGLRVREFRKAPADAIHPWVIGCELFHRDDLPSRIALDLVERRLWAINDTQTIIRLSKAGAGKMPFPTYAERKLVKSAQRGMGLSLAALVPLVLILMTITGAVYPAIDLTAGERERGTLETLIAAPVPRLGLLAAKYVAVLTVALLTATVNLTAMTITIYSIGLGTHLFGQAGLKLSLVVQVFGLLLLFAAFFSSVLLAVTSFARSFKEAQAYLIPLMLVSIAPGLLSLNDNLTLSGALAVTPLLNIVLLGRDLFAGTATPLLAVVVILSTLFFAMAALTVAAHLFGTDAILYGSHGSWSELFRRPEQAQPVASMSTAALCLASVFPAYFVVQGFLAQADLTMGERLWNSSLWSALLFGGVPAAVAMWRHVKLAGAFGLRPASAGHFAGALLLGISLWPLMHELVVFVQRFGLSMLDPALMERAAGMLRELQQLPLPFVLASIALTAAVFEELLFRGFFLQALLARTSPAKAILVSALAFGAFHILLLGNVTLARLLPATCMGLVLGWVCYRSGSVLPGMLLHACHNGILVCVGYYIKQLNVQAWGIEQQPHLPFPWILAGLAGSSCGLALMWHAGKEGTQRLERRPTSE